MTDLNFEAFFGEINGYSPFPWQQRLVDQVYESGRWPKVIDLPTGTGKTAVIDVAVFLLATDAARAPDDRRFPRRIVMIVDRKVIVDQAGERARRIAKALREAKAGSMTYQVASALRALGGDPNPLQPAVMRGGVVRDDNWARTPDQPVVAISTVDQVGSRLLFRGYGVSPLMSPVHAGLLGKDCLLLLDEVHLSRPFAQTLESLFERYASWAEVPLSINNQVVSLSATPGAGVQAPFRLVEEDREHKVLKRRLSARKPATLVDVVESSFDARCVKEALEILKTHRTVAIIVNRVASAQAIHALLLKKKAAAILLTGRMRPYDRDALMRRCSARIRSGRTRRPDDEPLVVVATQCIEAGADLDFDAMVTECASLDALRQRFGRVDRLGQMMEHDQIAQGVVIAKRPQVKDEADDPIYGEALRETWRWLQGLDHVDFGIGVQEPTNISDVLAPYVSAPIMLPAHLDAWVQTSPKPAIEPEPSLWLHGPERANRDVQLVWRADISARMLDKNPKEAIQRIAISPPGSAEALSVPIYAVRAWLTSATEHPSIADVEGDKQAGGKIGDEARLAVCWRRDDSSVLGPNDLRPGQLLVVPATYGGLRNGGWAPGAEEAVSDLGDRVQVEQRGRAILRLHPAVLGEGVSAPPRPPAESTDEDAETLKAWLKKLANSEAEDWLRSAAAHLDEQLAFRRGVIIKHLSDDEAGRTYALIAKKRRAPDSFGEHGCDFVPIGPSSSFTAKEVSLKMHTAGVIEHTQRFCAHLNLSDQLRADLLLAAELHDLGKLDPRFQRLLHGGSEIAMAMGEAPLAKSAIPAQDKAARKRAQRLSGYPSGTRHELMSVALLNQKGPLIERANDLDLVLHLIESHHGHCRPFAPTVLDKAPVAVQGDGRYCQPTPVSSDHKLMRLDSGVGDRFWRLVRRYGWHGLAWLEATLRLADHRQSERETLDGGAK